MSTEKPTLHTPEELLLNASILLETNDPKFMRSVIMESLASLESFIQNTVFKLLDEKMDKLLVQWLKDKTMMDLDGRLKHLTPLALDTKVDVSSNLWREYKEAKDIRNKVVHHSRAATRDEAEKVMNTVRDWLSYLGSNAEVNLSLLGLKNFLEEKDLSVINERDSIELIKNFYKMSSPYSTAAIENSIIKGYRADLVLDYGKYRTLFEVKLSKRRFEDSLVKLEHFYNKLNEPGNYRLVLIQFTSSEIPESYDVITKINDHTSVVFIKVK